MPKQTLDESLAFFKTFEKEARVQHCDELIDKLHEYVSEGEPAPKDAGIMLAINVISNYRDAD